jgi:hypothetical protein
LCRYSAKEGTNNEWSKWLKPMTFQFRLSTLTIGPKTAPYHVLSFGSTHFMLTENGGWTWEGESNKDEDGEYDNTEID